MATTAKASKNGSANRIKDKIGPKKSKAPEATSTIKIQPLNIGRISLNLRGISPLVVHNFSDKSRREMLEKQTGKNKKTKKEPRSPMEEFLGAFYVVEGDIPEGSRDKETNELIFDEKKVAKFLKSGTFGVPLSGFKNALISACRNTDLKMSMMKQTLFVSGADPTFAIIESKNPPIMDNRICRLAGAARTPIERFRPMWEEWSTQITIEYDANTITSSEVANLCSVAGFYVGICEGRPEKSSLGWGRWEIV